MVYQRRMLLWILTQFRAMLRCLKIEVNINDSKQHHLYQPINQQKCSCVTLVENCLRKRFN
jgi:hypothetical protein